MLDWNSVVSVSLEHHRLALGLTVGAGFVLYYMLEAVKRPFLASRSSAWRAFLQQHLHILQDHYWPTPWCFESRAQTIMASIIRSSMPNIKYKREVLPLKDGGQVCLDWLDEGNESTRDHDHPERPTVILLPGLTGCSQSEYVKSFVLAVERTKARCVVFNNRGRGGIELKTPRTYCAANSDDLEEAIDYIRGKFPDAPLMATGISLGGMIIGNYLATRGEKAANSLVAAMVLSIPWNVFVGTESLEKPLWNLLLNRHLANCLCNTVDSMRNMLEGDHKWDIDHVMKSKTIREFDTRFTALQFGYGTVENYYKAACLHDKLDRIKVPLLCLSAADDPFQPLEGIPVEAAKKSSHVAIAVTARGGHIGFMEGLFPSNTYYSDRIYGQLVAAIFNNLDVIKDIKKEAMDYSKTLETANDNENSEEKIETIGTTYEKKTDVTRLENSEQSDVQNGRSISNEKSHTEENLILLE